MRKIMVQGLDRVGRLGSGELWPEGRGDGGGGGGGGGGRGVERIREEFSLPALDVSDCWASGGRLAGTRFDNGMLP